MERTVKPGFRAGPFHPKPSGPGSIWLLNMKSGERTFLADAYYIVDITE